MGFLVAGIGVLVAALSPPVDDAASETLSAHMIQHLALMLVAAPLIALGAPVTQLLRSTNRTTRRRISRMLHSAPARFLGHPVSAWVLFGATLWLTHFSPLYGAALDNVGIHVIEHGLYIGVGLLFWQAVVGRDPGPKKMSWPARVGFMVAALPVQSFLGLALYSTDSVLYEHYALLNGAEAALDDQRAAALIMWLGGDALMLAAMVLCMAGWMRAEARLDARATS